MIRARTKIIIIIASVLAAILLIAVFLSTKSVSPTTLIQGTASLGLPADGSGITVSPKDNNVVIYSNGRNIVSQNLLTNQVNVLVNFGTLPEISQIVVSPDENYFLVQSQNHEPEDNFHRQLLASKLPTGPSRWWFIDRKTGAANPLPQMFAFVSWASDSKQFYSGLSSNGTSYVQAHSVSDLKHKIILETNQILGFRTQGDNFLLRKGDRLIRLDRSLASPTKILENVSGNTYYSPSGAAYASMTKNGKDNVLSIRFANNEKQLKIKQKNQPTAGAWNTSGTIFAYTASNNKVYLVSEEGERQLLTTGRPVLGAVRAITGEDTVIVENNLSLDVIGVSRSAATSKYVQAATNFSKTPDFASNNPFTLYYEPKTSILSISISQRPVDRSLTSALETLKNQGVDPEAIFIKVYISQAATRN